jgi:hypothetical protein
MVAVEAMEVFGCLIDQGLIICINIFVVKAV